VADHDRHRAARFRFGEQPVVGLPEWANPEKLFYLDPHLLGSGDGVSLVASGNAPEFLEHP
jgi:hypothetical protein